MPPANGHRLRLPRSTVVLLCVFLLAGLLGYMVVRDAVDRTVEQQALSIAEIVASQAKTARSVYAKEIAEKLHQDGFGPSVDFAMLPGHVPIPAQFLKLVGRAIAQDTSKLYEYKPVSKWNLESTQGLSDDFLRWAWPQLEKQDARQPLGIIAWKAVARFDVVDGHKVLRYLTADPASQPTCVACHNAYEQSPAIVAMRVAAGLPTGKQWKQHQLLGALSVTIPLEQAELRADTQVTQATLFLFVILLASFVSLSWFNWRLVQQQRSLLQAEDELARSERETEAANALLQAKQGVEQALAELSSYTQAIDQHALVSVTDRRGMILHVNDRFVAVSGYSADELLGQDHRILNSGTHDAAFFAKLWATIDRGDIWRGVMCNRAKSGSLYWVDTAIVPMRDASGQVTRYISIRIDITERKLVEHEMLHMATHDALTGLANRSMLLDRMDQALATVRRTGDMVAVLFIDLDQFKSINDTLGHNVGDLLLVEVAARLQTCVRTEDTLARQGGDEFIVFMPRIHAPQDAATLAQKLLLQLASPFQIGEHLLRIGSSIGIALFPDDGEDVDTLLKHSDVAMYQVKAGGRNNYRFYSENHNS